MYIDRTKLEFRINSDACPHVPIEILAIIPQREVNGIIVPEMFGSMTYRESGARYRRVSDEDLLAKLAPANAKMLYEALKRLFDPERIPKGRGDYARYETLDCAECSKSIESLHRESAKRFQDLSRLVGNYVTTTVERKDNGK